MDLKGSKTEQNLLTAFAGESQARNRYTYFASQARKEGFDQIAFIFEETANQEKEHAKRYFKFLPGGEAEIQWSFPAGKIGTTLENLVAAASGENYEHTEMYPGFAKVAREEGFEQIAGVFEAICVAERQHEKRYRYEGHERGGSCLQKGSESGLAVPELRVPPRRRGGPRGLSCLCPSQGLL